MNKKFSILYLVMFVALKLWATPIFHEEDDLKVPYIDTGKTHYILSINCNNEKCTFINGIIFAPKAETITVTYSGAHAGGGGWGGSNEKDTQLTITDLNTNKIINNPKKGSIPQEEYSLIISENSDYNVVLQILERTNSQYDWIVKTTEVRIVGVKADNIRNISFLSEDDKQKCITGFNGKLNQYVKINPYVESENAFIKPMGTTYPVWYVKKGTALEYLFYDNRLASNMSDLAPISPDIQMHPSSGSIVKFNGKEKNWIDIFKNRLPLKADEDICIEVFSYYDGPDMKGTTLTSRVDILVDADGPEITLSNGVEFKKWTNKAFTVNVKDETTGIDYLSIKNEDTDTKEEKVYSSIFDMSDYASGIYEVIAYDNVNNQTEQHVWIDKTGPEINFCKDENHQYPISFTADNKWTRQNIYLDFKDHHSGFSEYTDSLSTAKDKIVCGTGIHVIKAKDNLGNVSEETVYIDQTAPEFKTEESYFVNNGKRYFKLTITDVKDEHSGIKSVTVTPAVNDDKYGQPEIPERENGSNEYNYSYQITDNNIDNYIKFKITVTDNAGNEQPVFLGGKQGYFVPAAIHIDYNELAGEEKNRVKVNFYKGKYKCNKEKYRSIRLKRHFSLINSKNPSLADEITEANFGQTNSYWFNISAKGIWEILTSETGSLAITEKDSETYFIDTAIENTGFTHKNISYDCIYEYTNPVNPAETITEKICNDKIIKLTDNKGRYCIRVKGEDDTYLVIDDEGRIEKGSTETFKMPDTGVVELAVKVEDPDIEPYHVEIQGYAELVSEKGKFRLQETDTNPVETEGGTAGCGEFVLGSNNKNVFISRDKEMDGDWVKIGEYALQYNVTTVLAVELTEGFPGSQETWTYKTVRLYAKSPSVLGGKAQLLVGDAGSYNADGITARPNQPIKMEIVPAEGGQAFTDLFWDFGNGKTSKENDYGNYQKNSNSSFENIRYDQSPERTGALSEYTLKIKAGTDEAEFKVNIIDTQFGKLYGDEVWRGEHIIKKEIIVPQNMKLQIGNTAHSEYDSDITCLCVGKINAEDKAGITVEQGGTLILDEGDAKTIRFVQAAFKDDRYAEPAEEEKGWQNKWRGIAVKGNLSGDRLDLQDADCGLTVFPDVSIELSDSIKMENCGNGILMNGISFKTREIKLNGCSGYGLKLNSELNCEKLVVTDSRRGVVLPKSGMLTVKTLEVKDCITGIHLLGGKLINESEVISGCKEYGIKIEEGNYSYDSETIKDNERNVYEDGIIK